MKFKVDEMIQSLPRPAWWARFWPFFWHKELRMLHYSFYKGSVTVKHISKKHLFDLLIANNPKWWTPFRYVGFQLWI